MNFICLFIAIELKEYGAWLHDFVLLHYNTVLPHDLTNWEKLIGFTEKISSYYNTSLEKFSC
jgi:hypothetical protein